MAAAQLANVHSAWVQPILDSHTQRIQTWYEQGWLDGDLLVLPTILLFSLLGWWVMRVFCFSTMAAALFTPPSEQPSTSKRNNNSNLPAANATRSGRRRGTSARPKYPACPDDLEIKMVMVVRKDAQLKAADVATACCQAAIDAVAKCNRVDSVALLNELGKPKFGESESTPERNRASWNQWLFWWNEEGVAKVVVKADNRDSIRTVEAGCIAAGLPFATVGDGEVVAVGPAPVDDVNDICGDFKLF